MKHIDLFSGIGGFALAVDTVWPGSEHLFCEVDPYCQAVLKKHWPQSEIYGDIRQLITDTECINGGRENSGNTTNKEWREGKTRTKSIQSKDEKACSDYIKQSDTILTGGFPCQPFSHAGRRRGTDDDRYLWPEMFRVIQLLKPEWVVAENVRGLVTWNDGMVLEQVCSDLESEGYEVQPIIIPAVAVNAPHRRDRIWIVANRTGEGRAGDRAQGKRRSGQFGRNGKNKKQENTHIPDWGKNWIEVATELCGVDDGLSARVDGFELSKSLHRKERLKALGNAIVPQVAIQIMEAIQKS